MKNMLFDTSPIEDEDGKKKKKQARKKVEPEPTVFRREPTVTEQPVGYLASIEGHYTCDRCGLTTLDLIDIRKTDSGTKWLIMCGWWCLHSWLVDPIPGLLDKEDRKQSADVFRMRGGRYDGKSFDEIDADGARWYIESLVTVSKRTAVSDAARNWLDSH
jgi:hypothetical protein